MVKYPPPPTMPGLKVEPDLQRILRSDVAQLVQRSSVGFPGAQPVSFAARHLQALRERDYYVCEKSDGLRCLMYMSDERGDGTGSEVVYLIDRRNDFYYQENLHFPTEESETSFHVNTLVDGELVNDISPKTGGAQLKYLVFDCLTLSSGSLMHRPLDKRLAYFRAKVFKPYEALYKKYPDEVRYLPFQVEFKKMEFPYAIEMLFKQILPSLPHGNDGLIFTCRETHYHSGTDPNILKWKSADENSVDFRLHLVFPAVDPDSEDDAEGITEPYTDYSAHPQFQLLVNGGNNTYIQYGEMHVTPEEWESLKAIDQPLDERIVECHQDEQHRWRFMRFRDDKPEPNHISTVESVIDSINDRVSEEDLIAIQKSVRDSWKKRHADEQQQGQPTGQAQQKAQSVNGANGMSGMQQR